MRTYFCICKNAKSILAPRAIASLKLRLPQKTRIYSQEIKDERRQNLNGAHTSLTGR